jgi:hypothetical protein
MITKRDIEIVTENKSKLIKLNEDIWVFKNQCKYYSTKLFNNLLFKKYVNKHDTVICKSLKQIVDNKFYDKNIIRIEQVSCDYWLIKMYHEVYETLSKLRKQYWKLYNIYNKASSKIIVAITNSINDIEDKDERDRLFKISDYYFKAHDYSETNKRFSIGESQVMRVLKLISSKFQFYFFHLHRWEFCRDILPLEYDFYCILIYKGVIYQWVIEYDGDQHYDEKRNDFEIRHVHDIIKQYYLAELNIHLLRIREKTLNEICKKINKFINRIINSDIYVNVDPIIPIDKYFKDSFEHDGLSHFCETLKGFVDKSNKSKKISKKKLKIKFRVDEIFELNSEKSGEIVIYKESNEPCVFVTDDLKRKYGFIEEELNEQEILDFVFDKVDGIECSEVEKFNEDYEANRYLIELFMLIDKYNENFVDNVQNIYNGDNIRL